MTDNDHTPDAAGAAPEHRQWLARYISAWARHNVYFGIAGGRKTVQRYSDCFHAACLDINVGVAPGCMPVFPSGPDLSVAVVSDVMTYRFPFRHESVTQRGVINGHFLDAGLLQEQLFPYLQDTGRMSLMLLSIDHIYRAEGVASAMFIDRLISFLDALPGNLPLALEMHNGEFLLPEYFAHLRERDIVHVLNTSPVMPPLLDQIQLPHALTAHTVVVRTTPDTDPEWQLGIVETIRQCMDEEKVLYIYLNDDGVHPLLPSLAALMELLNPDLARLSPIRQKAA